MRDNSTTEQIVRRGLAPLARRMANDSGTLCFRAVLLALCFLSLAAESFNTRQPLWVVAINLISFGWAALSAIEDWRERNRLLRAIEECER